MAGAFIVHYQPKFSIRPEIPVLSSAEALVRWEHPTLGLIGPTVFVPLFEESGLIQELDVYVWRKAAAQVRDWKNRFDITVPVSVNVSRIDLYDPKLIHTLQALLDEFGLVPEEFLLEITESAYTRDTEQIIETANVLRALGFRIEMGDFGTGYSSLNMISRLPVDALKLDIQFIRSAFSGNRDTRMVEMIIDIADYLSVPVIAEGVETEEQLMVLKVVYQDDIDRALAFWNKATLLPQLEGGRPGVITYRLLMDGKPVYVEFKVTRMKGTDESHMVVGISNVDEQMRREAEFGAVKELANRDALTGVKSKHAYDETSKEINATIAHDPHVSFSMAVCDVNDLKTINDSQGHAAGDKYLRDACMMVCRTFAHSPVFRIGGDEFVAILRGSDYDNRLALIDKLEGMNQKSRTAGAGAAQTGSAPGSAGGTGSAGNMAGAAAAQTGSAPQPSVACGMAEYIPGRDTSLEDVFRRADEMMYKKKRRVNYPPLNSLTRI